MIMKLSEIIRYPSAAFERYYVTDDILQRYNIDDNNYVKGECFILSDIDDVEIPSKISVEIMYDFVEKNYRIFEIGQYDDHKNSLITKSFIKAVNIVFQIFDNHNEKKQHKFYDALNEYSWDTLNNDDYYDCNVWKYVNFPISHENVEFKLKQLTSLGDFEVKLNKYPSILKRFVIPYNYIPNENYVVI